MGGLFGGGGQTISTTAPIIAGFRVQSSAYAAAIARIFGKTRVAANLMWYGDFTAIAHTTTTESGGGGKGGGGSVTQSNTTYTYTAAALLLIGRGAINAVPRVWRDKEQITLADLGLSLYAGSAAQTPFPHLTTNHPGEALAYRGLAYVASAALDLGNNANLGNHSFEVEGELPFSGAIKDANPRDVVNALLLEAGLDAGFIGNLGPLSDYCVANGIFIAPAYTQQQPAAEAIANLARIGNAEVVCSEEKIKLVPYSDQAATGNGATYTPNVAPLFEFTDDDFLADSGDSPVQFEDDDTSDAYNIVTVQFYNRAKDYVEDVVQARDDDNIALYGERPMDPIVLHEIVDVTVARLVAQVELQRQIYYRMRYRFNLGPGKADLLEPMDVIAINNAQLGLTALPVRILEIEEIDDDTRDGFRFYVREFPAGAGSAAVYPSESGLGYSVNFNVAPGNVNVPVIFEPPLPLTLSSQTEIWMALSGGVDFGGCEVWASDDDATYRSIGVIYGGARHGVLTTPLPSGADPDAVNTLAVDLGVSRGQLISGTKSDADRLNTLCYVDGEYLAYQTATLTAPNRYDLTYLRRGAYGSAIAAHAAGTRFARLDDAIFKQAVPTARVGSPLYLKFPSFNKYGAGRQRIEEVPTYTYQILGTALKSPLPNPTNLSANYVAGITRLHWDGVTDFRSPIDYELRFGASWAGSTINGRTPLLELPIGADGTYWVSAHYRTPEGVDVYSAAPVSVVVVGAKLVANVVASYDEYALGWPGSVSGGALVLGGKLQLTGAGDYLDIADLLAELDILWMGGVASAGLYTNPAGHRIDVGRVEACSVTMPYSIIGRSIYDDYLSLADVLQVSDLLGAALGALVSAQPQIRIAQEDGIYGAWQNFQPGEYVGQHFDGRLGLSSSDPQVVPIVDGFKFAVDVPDRTDAGTDVAITAGGSSVAYLAPFNGGADGASVPGVQILVLNAQAGDTIVLSAQTLDGFTVQIKNGGVGVDRNINWISKGY